MRTACAAALSLAGCDRPSRSAATTAGWAGYNNTYDGQRFANLDQINSSNVARLRTVCELQLGEEGPFQAGPVVVGDTLFVTTAHTTVAMKAATCALYWRHIDSTGQQNPISVNRGVAYLDGRLFRGMLAGAPEAGDAAARGEQLYTQYCSGCHGTRGEGGAAPTLVGGSAPREVGALAKVIRDPPPAMPDLHPSQRDDAGVTAVAEYVRSLQAANQ